MANLLGLKARWVVPGGFMGQILSLGLILACVGWSPPLVCHIVAGALHGIGPSCGPMCAGLEPTLMCTGLGPLPRPCPMLAGLESPALAPALILPGPDQVLLLRSHAWFCVCQIRSQPCACQIGSHVCQIGLCRSVSPCPCLYWQNPMCMTMSFGLWSLEIW